MDVPHNLQNIKALTEKIVNHALFLSNALSATNFIRKISCEF